VTRTVLAGDGVSGIPTLLSYWFPFLFILFAPYLFHFCIVSSVLEPVAYHRYPRYKGECQAEENRPPIQATHCSFELCETIFDLGWVYAVVGRERGCMGHDARVDGG
jgi:hypothetical protein